MYTITFYSFKGGVGRTMALVNVAVELASRGKRVLAVDFDLEAPGLDTFDLPKPQTATPGLVEYVREYQLTSRAPDVRSYVYQAEGIGAGNGGLWVMPSGLPFDAYARDLGEIEWADLYANQDGYALFEDLKAQWKTHFGPDYVLIDSRTGHTDIAGICTRQFPDSVSIFFFPNTQNLRGLKKVVADIKREPEGARGKRIDLHFVMSNVPDLDDEEQILEERLAEFKNELGFSELTQTVYRYPSLLLLNQVVFTRDKPRSRLAREYQELTDALVRSNPEDREGAIRSLRELVASSGRRRATRLPAASARIDEIVEQHSRDSEVLHLAGAYRLRERRFDEARALLSKAIEFGATGAEVYLARAECHRELDDRESCHTDVRTVLANEDVGPLQLEVAARMLPESEVVAVGDSAAVATLDVADQILLASNLATIRGGRHAARKILATLHAMKSLKPDHQAKVRSDLILVDIGAGCFEEAARLALEGRRFHELDIQDAFNYAMALWATTGESPKKHFDRVVELSAERRGPISANYCQCMTVAHWAVGHASEASTWLERARSNASRPSFDFSCWRYARVSQDAFLDDLDSIERMIKGEPLVPAFMKDS